MFCLWLKVDNSTSATIAKRILIVCFIVLFNGDYECSVYLSSTSFLKSTSVIK